MQIDHILLVIVGVAIVLLLLDVILFLSLARITRHYNSLTKGIDKKTLTNVLQGIQQSLATHERSIEGTHKALNHLVESVRTHLHTPSLTRFNPFGDTGGDQSFILGLLDGNKDGIVITSLHSRENTRFYVKSVKAGVGIEHPLSSEEEKAINRKAK